jgi:hypothetical protein
MTILYTDSPDPELRGVVCDRCQITLLESVDLGEVLHVRLHAGYGSAWGDGNLVELELCDACTHAMLAPYARVTASAELLPGNLGLSLDRRHRLPRSGSRALRGLLRERPPALPSAGLRGVRAWARYWLGRGVIPLRLCLQPLQAAWAALANRMATEESILRADYWDSTDDR